LTLPRGQGGPLADGEDAYRACGAASGEVAEGSVGAGTGATVGKALGPRAAMKGGVGSWAASGGDIVVGALVVLNAVGNILEGSGAILAGARGAGGKLVDALEHFARGGAPFGAVAARNTTLAVVATNATLDRTGLEALAYAAGDALRGASFLTAPVRRRCRIRGQHRRRGARDPVASGGPRGAGGAHSGGARRAARAGPPRHSWSRRPVTDRLERDVADVARKWVPDLRLGVFDVTVEPQRLAGCTTSRDALGALRRIAADAGRAADVRLLPDASVREEPAAVVTAAVAPLLREPRITADRVSEALPRRAARVARAVRAGRGVGAGARGDGYMRGHILVI